MGPWPIDSIGTGRNDRVNTSCLTGHEGNEGGGKSPSGKLPHFLSHCNKVWVCVCVCVFVFVFVFEM